MITDLDSLEDVQGLFEFVRDEPSESKAAAPRLNLDASNAALGLGRLAVALVNLLHELLERQAVRRMERGCLSDEQVEQVGYCLMQQSLAIDELCKAFGIKREELNLDLGPLGKLF